MQSENAEVKESAPTIASDQVSLPATETPLAFRVVRGGFLVAASSYFNIGFGFLANLVLTRLLAPEAFGAFALGMFFFPLFNLRTKVAAGQALAQRPETTGELIGTHLALDMATGLASFVLALAAYAILLGDMDLVLLPVGCR